MAKSKSKQGGKRIGAGRKPAPVGTVKIAYSTKLPPRVVKYLRAQTNAAITIENAIERSEDYQEWEKSEPL